MLKYLEAIEELPGELKGPFIKVLELFKEEVAETVKRSDFEELKAVVTRLACSQEELAEAQKRTEKRVEELAEAQKRTEKEIESLSRALKETRKEVGGLSNTIGYTLENEAFKALPALLKNEFSLEVEGRLKREFLKDTKGRQIEVNILGKARKNGREVVIIGESKSQLSRRDVDAFLRRLSYLESTIQGDKICLLITHMTRPEIVAYAKEKGIKVYFSYEF